LLRVGTDGRKIEYTLGYGAKSNEMGFVAKKDSWDNRDFGSAAVIQIGVASENIGNVGNGKKWDKKTCERRRSRSCAVAKR
jgi:hypothetical protein